MPEGLRRPILPGGNARGGMGNCRWVRRATAIPTEPAMGSELEPNAQLSESRVQVVKLRQEARTLSFPQPQWVGHNSNLLGPCPCTLHSCFLLTQRGDGEHSQVPRTLQSSSSNVTF